MRTRRVGGLAAGLLVGLVGVAAGAGDGLAVRNLDTSRLPTVRLSVTTGAGEGPGTFSVRENGRVVRGLQVQPPTGATAIALVIDTSQSMRGRPLLAARNAALQFLHRRRPSDEVAVFAVGQAVTTVQPLTSAATTLDAAVGSLAIDPRPGTALNAGIAAATSELESRPLTTRRVIVVLADGDDNASPAGLTGQSVAQAAAAAQVTIYPIAVRSKDFAPRSLTLLAAQTGGSTHEAAAPDLAAAYGAIADELSHTYILGWSSEATGRVAVDVAAGDRHASQSYAGAAVTGRSGGNGVLPPSITQQPWSAPALVLLVVLLVLVASGSLFRLRPRRTVVQILKPYVSRGGTDEPVEAPKVSFPRHIAQSTDRLLGGLNFWKRMATVIERADVPLKVAELFYVQLGAGVGAGLLTSLVGFPSLLSAASVLVGAAVPYLVMARKAKKRQKAFELLLPDTLMAMASSLRAGHSFNQAMETVISEGSEPASSEFGRAAAEIRLGLSPDLALEQMAERLGSENFDFVVTSVNIQRQVGGSLAEMLDSVGDTVRARQQFRQKVKALTGTGRASAYMLVAMPFLVGGAITVINPTFIRPLYTTTVGQFMIMGALGSIAVGSVVINKIVNFKV